MYSIIVIKIFYIIMTVQIKTKSRDHRFSFIETDCRAANVISVNTGSDDLPS